MNKKIVVKSGRNYVPAAFFLTNFWKGTNYNRHRKAKKSMDEYEICGLPRQFVSGMLSVESMRVGNG